MAKSAAGKSKPQVANKHDARVDAKIAAASVALQPVLNHIRGLVHDAVPEATETVKWGMPFFEVDGTILLHLGIFKNHCSVGFWSRSMKKYLAENGVRPEEGAGSFGRIAAIDDLPPYKTLAGYTREAAAQIRNGQWQSPFAAKPGRAVRPEPPMPDDFAAALKGSPTAHEQFKAFSPSCRREYLDWITSAKRPETRARRVATALENIAGGKQHHWQYAKQKPAVKAGP